MPSEGGNWPKATKTRRFVTSSSKSLGATNPRTIKLEIKTDSQENIELQLNKSYLILESLKVNIFFKITYEYRHWTWSTSLEPHLEYLVALCFEKTKFISYVRLSTLKTLSKVFSGSGFQVLQFLSVSWKPHSKGLKLFVVYAILRSVNRDSLVYPARKKVRPLLSSSYNLP